MKVCKFILIAAMTPLAGSAMAQLPQKELSQADRIQQQMYNAFNAGLGDVYTRIIALNDEYRTSTNRDSIKSLMVPLQKIMTERRKEYLEQNPQTALAAFFLRYEVGLMSLDSLKRAYEQLDDIAKETTTGKDLANEITTRDRVAPGNPAPEITGNDLLTGKTFTLSSLKGKVVLLDFWASWCVPCRKSNPHVKALYDKYGKKGFDVVYVADDDSNPDAALKAIEKDGIRNYHHLLCGKKVKRDADGRLIGYDMSEAVSNSYAIHFLPTKYLIDREGNIIGKVEDEMLDDKLKEIFGF